MAKFIFAATLLSSIIAAPYILAMVETLNHVSNLLPY
jgi:hypothetical protein